MMKRLVSTGHNNPLILYLLSHHWGGGNETENNSTDRSKLGTKRHILTEKKGIPLSAVISSSRTHDVNLVIDAVDKAIIKRPKSSSRSKPRSRRRLLQYLYLDKGYKYAEEDQKLIKLGYILHIPIKKILKKGGKDTE